MLDLSPSQPSTNFSDLKVKELRVMMECWRVGKALVTEMVIKISLKERISGSGSERDVLVVGRVENKYRFAEIKWCL